MTAMTVIGTAAAGTDSLSKWVNPMIGTNGMGHTFPGACYPFGIVQLSPDTDTVPHNIDGRYQPEAYRYCAGYQYGIQPHAFQRNGTFGPRGRTADARHRRAETEVRNGGRP